MRRIELRRAGSRWEAVLMSQGLVERAKVHEDLDRVLAWVTEMAYLVAVEEQD